MKATLTPAVSPSSRVPKAQSAHTVVTRPVKGRAARAAAKPVRAVASPSRKVPAPSLPGGVETFLDSRRVVPSRWANRHPANFLTSAFLELKRDISEVGFNQIAINVRPVTTLGIEPAATGDYEVVYGHRRLQACLELGLPVRAIIEQLDDQQLVAQMHTENLHRKDLSAYERGLAYLQMIEDGLFKNQLALARHLRVSAGDVSRVRFLASLPPEVLAVIQTPLDLVIHDADKLRPALTERRAEVLHRAAQIAESEGELPAKQAVQRLTTFSKDLDDSTVEQVRDINVSARHCGQITIDGRQRVSVDLSLALTVRQIDDLEAAVCNVLRKALSSAKTAT